MNTYITIKLNTDDCLLWHRRLFPAMLKLIQDQKKEIDVLEKRLVKSEQEIEKLKSNK